MQLFELWHPMTFFEPEEGTRGGRRLLRTRLRLRTVETLCVSWLRGGAEVNAKKREKREKTRKTRKTLILYRNSIMVMVMVLAIVVVIVIVLVIVMREGFGIADTVCCGRSPSPELGLLTDWLPL